MHSYDHSQVPNKENVATYIPENSSFENLAALFPFGVIQLPQDEVGRSG